MTCLTSFATETLYIYGNLYNSERMQIKIHKVTCLSEETIEPQIKINLPADTLIEINGAKSLLISPFIEESESRNVQPKTVSNSKNIARITEDPVVGGLGDFSVHDFKQYTSTGKEKMIRMTFCDSSL